jgi:broad specificity phosphatase PhoE
MTRLLLVRHGEVEGIRPPRFRGRTELPLTELGRRQAAAAGQRIAQTRVVAHVYSSPMGRCLDTARAITGGSEPDVLEGLIDIDYGAWQSKSFDEVRAAEPAAFDAWFEAPETVRFPGGDSLQDLVARTGEALRRVMIRHTEDTIALVAHDSSLRALLLQLLWMPLHAYWRLELSPCGISETVIDEDGARVLRVNDAAHLEGLRG